MSRTLEGRAQVAEAASEDCDRSERGTEPPRSSRRPTVRATEGWRTQPLTATRGLARGLGLLMADRERFIAQASRITGSRAAAEDVVQEAYLRMAGTDAEAVAKPIAYVSRIVRNLATDWLRHSAWERPDL